MISASLFAGNMLSVSSATDDGAGNVSFTLAYVFDDDVAGFQFDLMTDGVVALTGAEGGAAGDEGCTGPTTDTDLCTNTACRKKPIFFQ